MDGTVFYFISFLSNGPLANLVYRVYTHSYVLRSADNEDICWRILGLPMTILWKSYRRNRDHLSPIDYHQVGLI
jgi:hypothetical protein